MPTRISDDDEQTNCLINHDARYLNTRGDKMLGDLDIDSNKLKNAVLENCTTGLPLIDSNVINKSYLDERLADLDAIYVNESGDTMTGNLRMTRHKITGVPEPTEETDVVNKRYVDKYKTSFEHGREFLQMQKPIDMNSRIIKELGDPIEVGDAVNKKYADKLIKSRSDIPYKLFTFSQRLTLTYIRVKYEIDGFTFDTNVTVDRVTVIIAHCKYLTSYVNSFYEDSDGKTKLKIILNFTVPLVSIGTSLYTDINGVVIVAPDSSNSSNSNDSNVSFNVIPESTESTDSEPSTRYILSPEVRRELGI